MTTEKDLYKFCEGKKIIIVGNSSRILQANYGRIIDGYEVIVRINRGYQRGHDLYRENIGSKTHILSLGIKSFHFASQVVAGNAVDYILSPIIYSDRLSYPNSFNVTKEEYNHLREGLGGHKPSTGIATFNFFNKLGGFERLDLIGFDFFESSSPHRNQLGHLRVPDHHGIMERKYFELSRDSEKTLLHPTPPGGQIKTNIPTIHIPYQHRKRYRNQ
tara:strand:+ start:780 stop:1430 length:651 start_codon:yes stop_codon:yes gene_type:complete